MGTEANTLSVRDRLKAAKENLSGTTETTLPVSGLKVTFPRFINHDVVMAASKLAGKNRNRIGMIVAAQVARFDGEKLTVDEIGSLLHNRDAVHIIDAVLGESDENADETTKGN